MSCLNIRFLHSILAIFGMSIILQIFTEDFQKFLPLNFNFKAFWFVFFLKFHCYRENMILIVQGC